MIGGSSASNLQGGGAVWRLATGLLALLIMLFVMGTLDDAHACPPRAQSHHATIKHKARAATVTAHVVSVSSNYAAKNSASIGHCCGGTSSSAGSSCKASCCSAGSAIADMSLDGAPFFDIPISYSSRRQGDLSSLEPAPRLRPPQLAI
jgi:hypothetical protein